MAICKSRDHNININVFLTIFMILLSVTYNLSFWNFVLIKRSIFLLIFVQKKRLEKTSGTKVNFNEF